MVSWRRVRRTPFERRRRLAARLALYGSGALLVVAALAGGRWLERAVLLHENASWRSVDYARVPEVELLQRYVRIDTSRLTGNEIPGAQLLAAELARRGIPSTLEILGTRSANLWAILEGELPEAIVLHSHIDVADVHDAALWRYPPFSAEIHKPWLFGRGAFDMKAYAIAQLLAFADLAKSGRRPHHSIILLATGGEEEGGSELGMRWILAHHPELRSRFWAMLTEGGAVEARSLDDIKYWGTEIGERRYIDVVACAASEKRLADLQDDLRWHGLQRAEPRLLPEIAAFLRAYGPSREGAMLRRELSDPAALVANSAAVEALPAYLREMLYDQILLAPITPAPGGGFQTEIRFLLLPDTRFADARAELLPEWMTAGVSLAVVEHPLPAPSSPTDHPVFRAIGALLRERYPGLAHGPLFLPHTFNDGRFVRALGIPSYGFTPFMILSTDTMHTDRSNERIGLPGYVEGVAVYRDLLQRLASE